MNKKHLTLAFFILLIPIALYFSFNSEKSTEDLAQTNVLQNDASIKHWIASNGSRVYFVQAPGLPIVDIDVMFNAGSARDDDKPGLSALFTHLLNKGTLDLNADQIAEKFEDSGAIYRPNVSRDKIVLSLRSLTDPSLLDPVVQLLSDLITKPSFPEDNITTVKNQTLIALKMNLQKIGTIAIQNFYRALYGNDPYAHPTLGTEASVSTLTKSDLTQFHQKYFIAQNATLVIVGDLTEDKAKKISITLIDPIPNGEPIPTLPAVSPLTQPIEINIPYAAEQTHILLGQPCAVVGDPDFFPLLVGNYVFGGNMLNSWLFKEVREDRGLAYSINSAVLELERPAPFLISAQTKNDQAKETIAVLKETLIKFIKEGPSEKELTEAKNGLINAFPLAISSNGKIASVVSDIAFYQLPLDFLNTYQKQIESVTLEQIKSAFERRIHPNEMALVVVGDPPH